MEEVDIVAEWEMETALIGEAPLIRMKAMGEVTHPWTIITTDLISNKMTTEDEEATFHLEGAAKIIAALIINREAAMAAIEGEVDLVEEMMIDHHLMIMVKEEGRIINKEEETWPTLGVIRPLQIKWMMIVLRMSGEKLTKICNWEKIKMKLNMKAFSGQVVHQIIQKKSQNQHQSFGDSLRKNKV
jgi:hypothetical protein